MTEHAFKVGARVHYRSPLRHHTNVPTSDFTVEALMPADAEGNQYRIENRADRHQRVVHEAELTKATFAPPEVPRNFSRF
jgi:hypothetical protein